MKKVGHTSFLSCMFLQTWGIPSYVYPYRKCHCLSQIFVAGYFPPTVPVKLDQVDMVNLSTVSQVNYTFKLLNNTFHLVHGFRSFYEAESAMATLKRTFFSYAFGILRRNETNIFIFHCLGAMSLSLLHRNPESHFLVLYFGLQYVAVYWSKHVFFFCAPQKWPYV